MIFQRLLKYYTRQNGNDAGFTIIEVLAAMIIFAVGILGVGKMLIVSIEYLVAQRVLFSYLCTSFFLREFNSII